MTPRRAMEVLLETPGEIFVHAFPGGGVTGVDPKFFSGPRDEEGELVPDGPRVITVKVSLNYPAPLLLDADGLRQVLSFEQVNSPVFIPWAAVFGMHKEGSTRLAWPIEAPVTKPPKTRLTLVSV